MTDTSIGGNFASANEEQIINTAVSGEQTEPSVTVLADGGWVVVWQSKDQDGSGWGIYGQRFNADGTRSGDELRVNSLTAGDQTVPSVAALADGGYVVAWTGAGNDKDIYLQRYNASGAAVNTQVTVNLVATSAQDFPTVCGLPDGGYVVAWSSLGQDNLSEADR
ncbi:hypothetical protein, partial [Insolitispirillum peregrinum]